MSRLAWLCALGLAACETGVITVDDPNAGADDPSTGGDGVTDSGDAVAPPTPPGGGDTGPTVDDTAPPAAVPSIADLAADGGRTFTVKGDLSTDVGEDCGLFNTSVDYTRYRPDQPVSDVVVVLSHGFARQRGNVRGWAAHLASHGFEVANVALCTADPFSIDHPRNGKALATFAAKAYPDADVIFVGHSAGGLASLLAATTAKRPRAVFGLDLVDSNGSSPIAPTNDPLFGAKAAPDLTVPLWGIRGKPAQCNENGNAKAAYDAAPDGRSYILTDASHCDFELPRNDGLIACTIGCPEPDPSALTNAEQTELLKALLLSFVLVQSGVDPSAAAVWTPGQQPFDTLTAPGGPLK